MFPSATVLALTKQPKMKKNGGKYKLPVLHIKEKAVNKIHINDHPATVSCLTPTVLAVSVHFSRGH